MTDIGVQGGSEELGVAWAWLHHATDLVSSGQLRSFVRSGQVRVPGARSILRSVGVGSSEVRSAVWSGVRGQRSVSVYTSPQREAVLRLCGWKGDRLAAHAQTDYLAVTARKAAVAIFNLDLRRALRELQHGAVEARNDGCTELANVLTMVSVAVSGFSSDLAGAGSGDSELWREMVSCSLSSLPHPALRAIFSFLTSKDDNYTSVLEEDGLLLVDRLGFAVTFLDDVSLHAYIDREWEGMLAAGRLDGVVLSGGDSDGVQLLQRYVDRTGDVQTVSWMAVRVLSLDLAKCDQVQGWVDSYRQLLDMWTMFTERAELDIALTKSGCTSQPCQQVFVCCHYCGKSVSPWYKGMPRGGQTGSLSRQGGGGGNKPKIQSCPHCKVTLTLS